MTSILRIVVVALALLSATSAAAQPPDRTVRIGLLDYGTSNPSSDARWEALRGKLRELGYVQGRNLVLEARRADGHVDRLPALAGELIAAKVDLVVTATSEAALAVKEAGRTVPVVMATGGDPVSLGLATSLSRPGGNVTGVTSLNSDLVGKRLELVVQLVPKATRVAILRDPDNRTSTTSARDAAQAGKTPGIAVPVFDLRAGELDATFAAIKRARASAVILAVNTPFIGDRQRFADLAIANRLPMMAPAREYAEAGALVSYGTDYLDLFRRAAGYVDRILRGARPGDLPIEQPTKFELVINLKTSRALGLAVPPSLLGRADEVIQ